MIVVSEPVAPWVICTLLTLLLLELFLAGVVSWYGIVGSGGRAEMLSVDLGECCFLVVEVRVGGAVGAALF